MGAAIANSRIGDASLAVLRLQGAETWWINEWRFGLSLLIPVYVLVYTAPLVLGPEIAEVRFRFYFDAQFFLLGLAFLLVLISWAALFVQLDIGRGGSASRKEGRVNPLSLEALGIAAITAYVIWFHHFIVKPKALLAVFSGEWMVFTAIWIRMAGFFYLELNARRRAQKCSAPAGIASLHRGAL